MIHAFYALNFKALRDVKLALSQLTLLVGPNGGGKTSVLEGIHLLSSLAHRPVREVLPDNDVARSLHTVGVSEAMELRFEFDWGKLTFASEYKGLQGERKGEWSYWLNGQVEQDSDLVKVTLESEPPSPEPTPVVLDDQPDHYYLVREHVDAIGTSEFLSLDAKRLAAPSYSDQEVPKVESDGNGLASALVFLKLNDPERFNAIESALRSVVRSVRAIRFQRQKVRRRSYVRQPSATGQTVFSERPQEYMGDAILLDTTSGRGLSARLCSEGTLLVLGLLTVVLGPDRPRLILLDDIDRALHPRAQEDLVDQLRKFLSEYPEVQIVATSHSPYLLDHVKPEEVRITNLDDDGSVSIGRLDQHEQFDRWKDEMTPGEFWSMVGENWISEKTPGAS